MQNYNIASARKTPLADVLLNNGYKLIAEGSGNFRVSGYQGLIIKENYWFRHSTKEYGNTIDFFTKIEGLTFSDAISKIIRQSFKVGDRVTWKFKNTSQELIEYLAETRKIDLELINNLIRLKKIKQDHSNCICFIQKNELGEDAYIHRRSTTENNSFKGDVKGSSKKYSFEINLVNEKITNNILEPPIKKVYIVEGAIDVCAMATLLKLKKNREVGQIKIISTAGYPHASLKNRILSTKPKQVIIATDMDSTGRHIAKLIIQMIPNTNYTVPIYNTKDPSELLINLKNKRF